MEVVNTKMLWSRWKAAFSLTAMERLMWVHRRRF